MNSLLEDLRAGVVTGSAAEAQALAAQYAALLPENTAVALTGDLGTGKTNWVKGMAQAWNIEEAITSPTFNLFTIYQGARQLIHLDAYRLETTAEAEALMLEDFLKTPWCLAIEWPERLGGYLPGDAHQLTFSIDRENRHRVRSGHFA